MKYRMSFLVSAAAAAILILPPAPADAGPPKKAPPAKKAPPKEAGTCEKAPAPPDGEELQSDPAMRELEKDFRKATALLYVQDERGTMFMMCTATAFEKKDDVYKFVSASHCLAQDDTTHDRVEVSQAEWFITFDDLDQKKFYPAKILAAGYQHNGDDFAVVEVKLDITVPTMSLAAADPSLGEDITNIASPGGLGKQLFRGHVSMEKLGRPLIEGDINWKGATLLQTISGPGSSGSAVVSIQQKGIVAFIVGRTSGSPSVVAIPVSKFKKFWADVQAGSYKWYKLGAGASGNKGPSTQSLLKTVRDRFPSDEKPAAEPDQGK